MRRRESVGNVGSLMDRLTLVIFETRGSNIVKIKLDQDHQKDAMNYERTKNPNGLLVLIRQSVYSDM